MKKIIPRLLSGTTEEKIQEYEIRHRVIARKAAGEGIVLLKNENKILPLKPGSQIALYGAGAVRTIKGGSGSGDVNARSVVSIYEGMKNAGFQITNESWLKDYEQKYETARNAWRQEIWEKTDRQEGGLWIAYTTTPFTCPEGEPVVKTEAETAIYVLSRTAGEAADRVNRRGDYELSEEEEETLSEICRLYSHVILVLNVGSVCDLSILDREERIESVVYLQQAGMESGNALADMLSGKVVPSGKLTDTWALHYGDYPASDTFSHNSGDVSREFYTEGIYVGYRYFDTFRVPVRYGFGYGLSYASFQWKMTDIVCEPIGNDGTKVTVSVRVTNTSECYAGREVIQVYAACPQGKRDREYRRLVSFAKTALLECGQTQELKISFPLRALETYDETIPGWVLEKGNYGIFMGNSLEASNCSAILWVDETAITEYTEHICPVQSELKELQANREETERRRREWTDTTELFPVVRIAAEKLSARNISYGPGHDSISREAAEFTERLTEEQRVLLATGETSAGQNGMVGVSGMSVPGAAAETGRCAIDDGLASIVLADGPAGLRLLREYKADENGLMGNVSFDMAVENGYLSRKIWPEGGKTYYQYCTAIPVGTSLAQTWDMDVLEECGKLVAEEMLIFGITLWLAPGMNIHRNPLCGRNFEYYSEDPVVSGYMAAAMTKGVQSVPGCGTTIKHFACNNQEDNRRNNDSILTERTLREIYLRGFEIAVKEAAPMAMMTSYNLINGIHAANSYDLCTKVARNEWGFGGVIMTDWSTTNDDESCTASGCMKAGNDLVMPGTEADHENIRQALKKGTLKEKDLKRSVGRLVEMVWKSNRYEA